MLQFENFRMRRLKAINALNFYITLCMAFLAIISMESESNAFKVFIIKTADPIKEKGFYFGILSYAKRVSESGSSEAYLGAITLITASLHFILKLHFTETQEL